MKKILVKIIKVAVTVVLVAIVGYTTAYFAGYNNGLSDAKEGMSNRVHSAK